MPCPHVLHLIAFPPGHSLFSLANLNVTTNAEFSTYLKQTYIPNATDAQVAQIAAAYPQDPTQGSPFGTGLANALTPQYKRLAAVQGDLVREIMSELMP